MSITSQVDTITRAILFEILLRERPRRVAEMSEATGLERRTTERLLVDLRKVGAWRRAQGLPWFEVTSEAVGRERRHRLVDRPPSVVDARRWTE